MQDLIEHTQRVSRGMVEDLTEPREDILPVMVCRGPHGVTIMVLHDMSDDDAKDQLATWMVATLAVARADAAITVTTAWMARIAIDDPDVDLWSGTIKEAVADRPDRTEGVALMCASRDQETMFIAPLTRYDDKPPTLGDWSQVGDGTGMAFGRFGEAMYTGLKIAREMPTEMADLIDEGWAEDRQEELIQRFVNVADEVRSGHE